MTRRDSLTSRLLKACVVITSGILILNSACDRAPVGPSSRYLRYYSFASQQLLHPIVVTDTTSNSAILRNEPQQKSRVRRNSRERTLRDDDLCPVRPERRIVSGRQFGYLGYTLTQRRVHCDDIEPILRDIEKFH